MMSNGIFYIINNDCICVFDNNTQIQNKSKTMKKIINKYSTIPTIKKWEKVDADYVDTLANMYLFDFRENQSSKRIKDWYISNYPDDKLGEKINNKITFHQFMECLKKCEDYTRISGKVDSIIYDRIAGRLCEIYHVSGEEIHDMFLNIKK